MEHVSSRHNPLVKRFRDAARGGGDDLLLDGDHLLNDAIRAGLPIEIVAFVERLAAGPLADAARRAGAKIFTVSAKVLEAISPVQHPSGVVALAARRSASLEAALAGPPQLALLVHDVQDPGNVGAIIRAAEAFGASGVVCGEGTADPFGWKALRGSMGSAFRLPVAPRQPMLNATRRARLAGLRVYAAVPRGGTPLPDADLRVACAILLGGEGDGLGEPLLALADDRMTIPMRGTIESLNVAASAALIMYEADRQRTSQPAARRSQG